jgi:hypothetical protein
MVAADTVIKNIFARLSNQTTFFTAEANLKATKLTFKYIKISLVKRFPIFFDCSQ